MTTSVVAVTTKWGIDPAHSAMSFKIKHLMISYVRGSFKEFGGSIATNGVNYMTNEIDFWMNVASIDSGDIKRDEHLRSADFFDAAHYPKITFMGSSYAKATKDGHYTLTGDLTMKGVTKVIKLDVAFGGVMHDLYGNEKIGFAITGKLNRKDWGLTWNAALEAGGMLVSEEVNIACEVQLMKQIID